VPKATKLNEVRAHGFMAVKGRATGSLKNRQTNRQRRCALRYARFPKNQKNFSKKKESLEKILPRLRVINPRHGVSALPPKADMCSAQANVRFVPIADINDMSDAAATAGVRGGAPSAGALRR
jgi:hypothetical protein